MAETRSLTPQQELLQARERTYERYVFDHRNHLVEYFHEWKRRIEELDDLYAGRWEVVFPDEQKRQMLPVVMNLVQVGMDDLSRLVYEGKPEVRVKPKSDKKRDKDNALLREKVFETYWLANKTEIMVPQFCHDLVGTGFAAMAVSLRDSDYPVFTRLDPRGCYPHIVNGELVDLIVISRMKRYMAEELLDREIPLPPNVMSDRIEVELVDHYNEDRVSRLLIVTQNSTPLPDMPPVLVDTWEHGLDAVPVAYAKLQTFDGAFRGMYDQIKGIVLAQNRILQYTLDYAQQMVYSPFQSYMVDNDTDPPGPNTIYRKLAPEGGMERVPPAGSQPELFNLLSFLDDQGRGGAAYPRNRQGNVAQSQASASFVNSTLGQLTTGVKHLQTQISTMREDANELASMIDCKFLNKDKSLVLSIDEISNYTPDLAFKDKDYRCSVLYGAGAGLDALNKKVAILQDRQAGLISKKTARRQTDYIIDSESEEDEIDEEELKDAFKAQLAQSSSLTILAQVISLMDEGKSLGEAAGIVTAALEQEQQAQEAQAGQQPTGAPPGPTPEQPTPQEQQTAITKGATGPPNINAAVVRPPA